MKKLTNKLIPALFLFAALSGCTKPNGEEEALCGNGQLWNGFLTSSDLVYENLDIVSGNRTLIYENLSEPVDICIDEITNASFHVEPADNVVIPNSVILKGKAYWGQSQERFIDLDITEQMSGLNLKSGFSSGPGWIGLQIIFEFPTQGSLDADKQYADSLYYSMDILYNYHQEL